MVSNPLNKTFLFFSVLIYSLAAPSSTAQTETTGTDALLPLSSLAVPEEIGKVQERFRGKEDRTIIQIQDVHAQAVAQQNIAAILERIRTVFGIDKVALEGAWSSTSLPKSHALPTSREKQLLAVTLLEKDLLSGPVYAAVMSPEPITLTGIENADLYEKNRAVFLAHLEKEKEIAEKIAAYGGSLANAQKTTWGAGLLAFGTAFGKFRETSDLGKFFPVLLQNARAQDLSFEDLPQIALLRDIMALEKEFTKERLEKEMKALMREYKNKPWTLEELIRGGKIPPERLGVYPEIKKLTHLYQLRDRISLSDLMVEIGTLTGRILGAIVKTPEEKALWERTERFYLTKKVLLLQATPGDLKDYEAEKPLVEKDLSGVELEEGLAMALHFYELVKERDEIFFERIANDPALAGDIMVITGGFHTDGLSQKLRDAGISYITITPDLGDASANEKLYNERMRETLGPSPDQSPALKTKPGFSRAADQTLSELRNRIDIDEDFPPALEVLQQTHDVRRAETRFSGNTVPVSAPDRIAHLSREGKVVRKPGAGTAIEASGLRVSDFTARPRSEQLESVRAWLTKRSELREKAMLVSSVSILARMLAEEKVPRLLEEAEQNGDKIALAQDVPAAEMPENLLSMRGVERFEASDIGALIENTPRFKRLAKKSPFAIMENGRQSGTYVVLPEKPVSLVLFRIVTLSPNLYQAAKDPAFLALLEGLVTEILSEELPKKAA